MTGRADANPTHTEQSDLIAIRACIAAARAAYPESQDLANNAADALAKMLAERRAVEAQLEALQGNLDESEANYKALWERTQLWEGNLRAAEARVKALEKALQTIGDGIPRLEGRVASHRALARAALVGLPEEEK